MDGALITISSVRGKPKGSVLKGQARVLPKDEWVHAEETLAPAYGDAAYSLAEILAVLNADRVGSQR
jgi:hypothetical protein